MEIYDINTIYSQYKEFINSNYIDLKDEVEMIVRRIRFMEIGNLYMKIGNTPRHHSLILNGWQYSL